MTNNKPLISQEILRELYRLSTPGVYLIANFADRKVDVRHAVNCLDAVTKHLTQIWDKTHPCKEIIKDRNKIEFQLLERIQDLQHRMLAQSYWTDQFKDKGYSFYRFRPALKYRVKIYVENYEARVKLVNSNHDSFVVGCFKSMNEAEQFIEQYYASKIPYPVYAINEVSKAYFRGLSKR